MAKIDQYQLNGDTCNFINVSAVVGKDAVNFPDDVMVVQALLKYLPRQRRGIPDSECPEPSGAFDKATARAIRKFQKHVNRHAKHYRVIEDGCVSPAYGKFALGSNSCVWTIRKLNEEASEASLFKNMSADGWAESFGTGETLINDLCRRWPQVAAALDGIGSLGLDLE